MTRKPGWIRRFHPSSQPGRPPLLVFPHAGAGASAYRDFSKSLSQTFDVAVVQYPGRQDRAAEALPATLRAIAAGAFEEFVVSQDSRGDLLVFGHSMGAMVGFEFVRAAEAAGVGVRRLFVAAMVAPHLADSRPRLATDDRTLRQYVSALGGTVADVVADEALIKRALAVVRADFAACNAYSCTADVKVAAPIHALGGEQDREVSLADLYGWAKHSDDVEVTLFDGGHFFVGEHRAAVADLLAKSTQT